jgi:hypothetical protein
MFLTQLELYENNVAPLHCLQFLLGVLPHLAWFCTVIFMS